MVSNQILTEHGKITSQAQKKHPEEQAVFAFFARNVDSNLTTRTLQVLGLSIHGKDRNPNVFKSRLEPAR